MWERKRGVVVVHPPSFSLSSSLIHSIRFLSRKRPPSTVHDCARVITLAWLTASGAQRDRPQRTSRDREKREEDPAPSLLSRPALFLAVPSLFLSLSSPQAPSVLCLSPLSACLSVALFFLLRECESRILSVFLVVLSLSFSLFHSLFHSLFLSLFAHWLLLCRPGSVA